MRTRDLGVLVTVFAGLAACGGGGGSSSDNGGGGGGGVREIQPSLKIETPRLVSRLEPIAADVLYGSTSFGVLVIDEALGEVVAQIDTPCSFPLLAVLPDRATAFAPFVEDRKPGIAEIDTATHTVWKRYATQNEVVQMIATPDGSRVYFADSLGFSGYIDTAREQLVAEDIRFSNVWDVGRSWGVTPHPAGAWLVSATCGTFLQNPGCFLTTRDVASGALRGMRGLQPGYKLAVTQDTWPAQAFIGGGDPSHAFVRLAVRRVDLAALETRAEVEVAASITTMRLSTDEQRLVVGYWGQGELDVRDADSLSLLEQWRPTGTLAARENQLRPMLVEETPTGYRAWVSRLQDGTSELLLLEPD